MSRSITLCVVNIVLMQTLQLLILGVLAVTNPYSGFKCMFNSICFC